MVAKLPTASPRIYTGQQSRSGTVVTLIDTGKGGGGRCNNYSPWESILLMSDAFKLHILSSAVAINNHGTADV